MYETKKLTTLESWPRENPIFVLLHIEEMSSHSFELESSLEGCTTQHKFEIICALSSAEIAESGNEIVAKLSKTVCMSCTDNDSLLLRVFSATSFQTLRPGV